MSEEQNDSPAFRLRPRRAAPKSYYTVRLEYSANPAAFIRERPRTSTKRKVFTQKSGSNSTKAAYNQSSGDIALKLAIKVSKEEREREQRRISLRRSISESITSNMMISPFMQRLQLDELEPNTIYEHNYITLKIIGVEKFASDRLLYCYCCDNATEQLGVIVSLYGLYAECPLVKPGKLISIAKFKTSLKQDGEYKIQGEDDSPTIPVLPFHVIVRCDELADERSNSYSGRGSPSSAATAAAAAARLAVVEASGSSSKPNSEGVKQTTNDHNMIPFISITDMIEEPVEPFVEMLPSSPMTQTDLNNDDHENQNAKKVEFAAKT